MELAKAIIREGINCAGGGRHSDQCCLLHATEDVQIERITALFDQWNLALSSLDAGAVADRYWPDAMLLASTANVPRTSPAAIRDYFNHFLAMRPRGRIDSRSVHIGCNLAIDSGTYVFSLMSPTGGVSELSERYTFVYQYRNGSWKILHQHASSMPEAPALPLAGPVADVGVTPTEPGAAKTPAAGGGKSRGKRSAKTGPKTSEDEPSKVTSSVMFLNRGASPEFADFYPQAARASGEHGTVGIRVCADPKGHLAGPADVLSSSGSKALDVAAQEWAKAAKWVPATTNGNAVEGCAQISVAFGN